MLGRPKLKYTKGFRKHKKTAHKTTQEIGLEAFGRNIQGAMFNMNKVGSILAGNPSKTSEASLCEAERGLDTNGPTHVRSARPGARPAGPRQVGGKP